MYQKKSIKIQNWDMYQVDTNGTIYSKNGKPLKYSINKKGYCIVNFYNNHVRKGFAVHTLVATTFIPHSKEHNQINHIDGNKENNKIENLEWCTCKENISHSIFILNKNKLRTNNPNHKEVKGYDKNTGIEKYSFKTVIDAGMFFSNYNYKKARNIQNIISQIANNGDRYKSYRGCIWKYNLK